MGLCKIIKKFLLESFERSTIIESETQVVRRKVPA